LIVKEDALCIIGAKASEFKIINNSSLRNGRVAVRVAALQEEAASRTAITIESLIREADEIQRAAVAAGNHSAAIAAVVAKAKLSGLWIDRRENKNAFNYVISDELPTEEQ
jgi:hypothetical protein